MYISGKISITIYFFLTVARSGPVTIYSYQGTVQFTVVHVQ
jgi:hypothetical protein